SRDDAPKDRPSRAPPCRPCGIERSTFVACVRVDVLTKPHTRVTSVMPHTYSIGPFVHSGANGGIETVSGLWLDHPGDDFLSGASDYGRKNRADEIVRG